MCEVLCHGKLLRAYPHVYPHAVHIFCGHRDRGEQCPKISLPFLPRHSVLTSSKYLIVQGVYSPTPTLVLWFMSIRAHGAKIGHAFYGWSFLIHNFASNEGDYAYSRTRFDREAQSHCVMHVIRQLKDGMIPPVAARSSRSREIWQSIR
jgi:hypothetical protein